MKTAFEMSSSFRTLTPVTPVMPYRISDLLQYAATRQTESTLTASRATYEDEVMGGLHSFAKNDADTCARAISKLHEFQAGGEDIVYLDVTQDIPKQIEALTVPILRR